MFTSLVKVEKQNFGSYPFNWNGPGDLGQALFYG